MVMMSQLLCLNDDLQVYCRSCSTARVYCSEIRVIQQPFPCFECNKEILTLDLALMRANCQN